MLLDSEEITYTGLSEVSLKDIQHALTITLIHFLESELSPNVQFLISDGYVEFCKMNQKTILAYSPLNRGFWSDITTADYTRLASDTFRSYLSMWQKENFEKLYPMLEQVQKFAKRKSYATSEIVLAWIIRKGCVPIAGSCSYANNVKNISAFEIELTEEEVEELDSMVADMTVKFGIKRYK
jgi:aryl-alcohol dehydrogenase-like predicted oxidoreductase